MFFKSKKEKPIFLDCYTSSHFAYNNAKIDYSHKYIPEWWKNESKFNKKNDATIKYCKGFIDYYAKGIVIPLWGEVEINVNPINFGNNFYGWTASNEDFDLHSGSHEQEQWSGFAQKNRQNIKFLSPWAIKTRELIYFTFTQPTWSQSDTLNGLTLLPGVMQFKTQTATHMNYMVEQNEKVQNFNIQPLTPMAILHPMTDRKIEIRHHLVDKDKFKAIRSSGAGMNFVKNIFDGSRDFYVKRERFWKKADEINKCPFQ